MSVFLLSDSCRNWKRKKARRKRSDWSWRERGGRETKSGSERGSAATVRKRRRGSERKKRSGTENVNVREIENVKRLRSGRGVETSVKLAASPGQ